MYNTLLKSIGFTWWLARLCTRPPLAPARGDSSPLFIFKGLLRDTEWVQLRCLKDEAQRQKNTNSDSCGVLWIFTPIFFIHPIFMIPNIFLPFFHAPWDQTTLLKYTGSALYMYGHYLQSGRFKNSVLELGMEGSANVPEVLRNSSPIQSGGPVAYKFSQLLFISVQFSFQKGILV